MELSREYGQQLSQLNGPALIAELTQILDFIAECGEQRVRDRGSYLVIEGCGRLGEAEHNPLIDRLSVVNPHASSGVHAKLAELRAADVCKQMLGGLRVILDLEDRYTQDSMLELFVESRRGAWHSDSKLLQQARHLVSEWNPGRRLTAETAFALLDALLLSQPSELFQISGDLKWAIQTYAFWATTVDADEQFVDLRECVHLARDVDRAQIKPVIQQIRRILVRRRFEMPSPTYISLMRDIIAAAREYGMPGLADEMRAEYNIPDPPAEKPRLILRG